MRLILPTLALLLTAFAAGSQTNPPPAAPPRPAPPAPPPMPPPADLIAPGAVVRKLAGGFRFTEGPTADAAGNVYFTDQPNDRIHVWRVEGRLETLLEPAGRSNGLCFDGKGALWACADGQNELWKIDVASRQHEVVLKDRDGKLFNGPNDVWTRPGGGLYFTDPLFKRPYWKHRDPAPQLPRLVYYLAPGGKLSVADEKTRQPNGIVGSPDGKRLYVADAGAILAYDIQEDGSLASRRVFCKAGSDGMTLDEQGNLYLTGKGVQVYNGNGEQIGQIDVPENWTANICFGGPERKTLFITASTGLYALDMRVTGAPQ